MILIVLLMLSFGRLSSTFRVQAIRYGRPSAPLLQNSFLFAKKFSTLPSTSEEPEEPELSLIPLRRGDQINLRVLQFGPLGASVSVNQNTARGLVLQSEISFAEQRTSDQLKVGDELKGYVERIREDGKVDVSLRPVDLLRVEVMKNEVLAALKAAPNGTIEIGDKSRPERIGEVLKGMSKTDFKNAVGALYKEGLVQPSKLWTKLIPAERLEESKTKAKELLEEKQKLRHQEELRIRREKKLESGDDSVHPERNNDCTLFVGNLPPNLEPKLFIQAVQAKILPENIMNIRLCKDDKGLCKGFGYVELSNESLVEASIPLLKGYEVGGRKLRVDYADPEKRYKVAAEANREYSHDEESVRRRRGGDVLSAPARRGLLSERVTSSTGGPVETVAGGWAPRYDPSQPAAVAKPSRYHPATGASSVGGSGSVSPYKRQTRGHADPTRPAFEATLYIGNLPFDAAKEELQNELLQCVNKADIASVRIIYDRETGQSKGYGYVDLYTTDAAEKLYEEMHNHEFRGRPMKIDDASS